MITARLRSKLSTPSGRQAKGCAKTRRFGKSNNGMPYLLYLLRQWSDEMAWLQAMVMSTSPGAIEISAQGFVSEGLGRPEQAGTARLGNSCPFNLRT